MARPQREAPRLSAPPRRDVARPSIERGDKAGTRVERKQQRMERRNVERRPDSSGPRNAERRQERASPRNAERRQEHVSPRKAERRQEQTAPRNAERGSKQDDARQAQSPSLSKRERTERRAQERQERLDQRSQKRQEALEQRTKEGRRLSRSERQQLRKLQAQQERRQLRAQERQERLQQREATDTERNLRQRDVQRDAQSSRGDRARRVTRDAAAQGRFAARYERRAERRAERRVARVAARQAWRRGLRATFVAWSGPIFWPYVYSDIFEYTFWPTAYEEGYWAYVYDDFFDSIFWGYGSPYSGYTTAGLPAKDELIAPRRRSSARVNPAVEQLCKDPGKGITAWPFGQIEQAVRPSEEQRALLQELKDAAARAGEQFRQSCVSEFAMTPPERLKAIIKRLEATREAVHIVRPPLEAFYNALSDEQKARFNEIGPDLGEQARNQASETQGRAADSNGCGDAKPGLADFPIDRIEEVVQLRDNQQQVLDRLSEAAQKAVDELQAACPNVIALTPVGRLEIMEKRLDAMIRAANLVLPALEEFYATLDNEQKARFNVLGRDMARGG